MNTTEQPILGIYNNLDELFEGYRYEVAKTYDTGEIAYARPLGWIPLLGLPGSLDTRSSKSLSIKPRDFVRATCQRICTNGVIGHFRSIQSPAWKAKGLLPVYVSDPFGHRSYFIALVNYSEHERFDRKGC